MIIYVSLLSAVLLLCAAKIEPSFQQRTSENVIKKFQTVNPQILHKTRPTRNAHSEQVDIKITTESGEAFTLRLILNDKLISPNFVSIYYTKDGQQMMIRNHVNCFYHGQVLEYPEWKVAMDTCQGLRGSFGDWNNKSLHYILEPLSRRSNSLEQPHLMYLAEDSIQNEGQCGTPTLNHDTMGTPTNSHSETDPNLLHLDQDIIERARRQTNPYFVEVHVVNDFSQYQFYNGSLQNTVNRSISIINAADVIFSELNIRIVGVSAETWSSGDRYGTFNMDPSITLSQFRIYVNNNVSQPHDAATLFTRNRFSGNTVGFAYLNAMCGEFAASLVRDSQHSSASIGSIFAHELGHNFDMYHDNYSICLCGFDLCVMSAVVNLNNPAQTWSSCSVDTLNSVISRTENNLARCLHNTPSPDTILGSPMCGDGIVQGDEQCDCGGPQECNDPCCNATSCTLVVGAQCHVGDCCTSQCNFKNTSSVCRPATGTCDIEDRCTGLSADCPPDAYLVDGSPCNNDEAYCISGECKTYNAQCQKHFLTNKGIDECFNYNTNGDVFGNCGSNGTAFIPCHSSDVMCGMIFCINGTFQNLNFAVYIVTVYVNVGELIACNAFTPPATSDVMSPGLVEDGIKCGSGKICYDQRCVNISSLGFPQCPIGSNGTVCSGNGVCNNEGRCSCFVDFTGETCENQLLVCNPSCQNGGNCTGQNICECINGYIGNQSLCSPGCENGGTCIAPDTCNCVTGYSGDQCQNALCSPGCENGGTCTAPDTCDCVDGYFGDRCQNVVIFPFPLPPTIIQGRTDCYAIDSHNEINMKVHEILTKLNDEDVGE